MLLKLRNLLRSVVKPGATKSTDLRSKADAQDALFELFEKGLAGKVNFVPLTEVDQLVAARTSGFLLKHDVHDVELDRLIAFAEREANLGIRGTYFFMTPDHPRTERAYGFADQIRAMRAVQQLGHELGLHFDPYYQMHRDQLSLDEVLRRLHGIFAEHRIAFRIGNMHGNSAHKHPDLDGFGTSFDLFEELSRQRDFPGLSRVPPQTADLIRSNRVQLKDHGYTHWGDMPLWSAQHGIVTTNFLTDNRFGANGTFEILVRPETTDAYYICPYAVPGSRNLAGAGQRIAAGGDETKGAGDHLSARYAPDAPELQALLATAAPFLILIHPEFYC